MKDSKKAPDTVNRRKRKAEKPTPQKPKRVSGKRGAIVQRLWKAAERQVRDIESRLMLAKQEPAERERDTRMMAVLVKTLGELSALDGAKPGAKSARLSTPTAPEQHDDSSDDIPRDIEEFRRELARRIAGLAAEAATETDNGT